MVPASCLVDTNIQSQLLPAVAASLALRRPSASRLLGRQILFDATVICPRDQFMVVVGAKAFAVSSAGKLRTSTYFGDFPVDPNPGCLATSYRSSL
jgi:hypothetical protein